MFLNSQISLLSFSQREHGALTKIRTLKTLTNMHGDMFLCSIMFDKLPIIIQKCCYRQVICGVVDGILESGGSEAPPPGVSCLNSPLSTLVRSSCLIPEPRLHALVAFMYTVSV